MTSIQLNSALHRELSYIVTDEAMMERALKSLRKIRKERKVEQKRQMASSGQVESSMREAFTDLKLVQQGKMEARPIEELFDELHY